MIFKNSSRPWDVVALALEGLKGASMTEQLLH